MVQRRLIAILVALLVAISGIIWWCGWDWPARVWWCSWKWLRTSSSNLESGSTTIRNVGLVIGGGIAIALAWWRSIVADRQARASQQQAETSQRGLLNERYQKGAEMLGSSVLPVRLGGIYALQRLVGDEPDRYHVQITHLFCSFVSHPTDDKEYMAALSDSEQKPHRLREDVQAAMTAIGTRSNQDIARDLILEGAYLVGAYLSRAELSGVSLSKANLADAYLFKANLNRTYLNSTDLTGAYLSGADLNGAHLFNANLTQAELSDATLTRVKLSDAVLTGADLTDADLTGAVLTNANLTSATLRNTTLTNAMLRKANLTNTILKSAKLDSADLTSTNLGGADLGGAYLAGAYLTDSDLSGAYLTGADLTGAVLFRVKGLTQSQLNLACANPDNPPNLGRLCDAETGAPLEWRERRCGE